MLRALPPIDTNPAVAKTTGKTLAELASESLGDIWASLMARMKFADSDAVKFEATKLALAYAAGPPPSLGARDESPSGGVMNAPRPPVFDLSSMTQEELDALRVLQLGAQRRRQGR